MCVGVDVILCVTVRVGVSTVVMGMGKEGDWGEA